jgi:ribosome assembly protein SQT1
MSANAGNGLSGNPAHEQEEYEGEGPQEIFLDDDDIAELQAQMDEEDGDMPMDDEDDDDVEEVTEAPEGYEGEEGDGMDEAIPDQALRHFTAHERAVFTVSAHPTCPVLVVTGGEDDNGFLWRTDTGEEIAKLTGHTDSVICTGWSSDGEMVATGGMDGLVRVWRRVKAAPGQWEWSRWEFLTVLEGMDEVMVSGEIFAWSAVKSRLILTDFFLPIF